MRKYDVNSSRTFPAMPSAGRVCRGDFSPAAAALSLAFRDEEGLISNATYRAVDANSERPIMPAVRMRGCAFIFFSFFAFSR